MREPSALEVKQVFMQTMTNENTPVSTLIQLYSKPIPSQIGQLQCTIVRDKSGLNKLEPKYLLRLSMDDQTIVMRAVKLFESATTHYKISVVQTSSKFGSMISMGSSEDESYIGRLRSTFGNSSWYIFDGGANPKDKKSAGMKMRRQFGTILYSDKDKLGKKVPRNMEVYVP